MSTSAATRLYLARHGFSEANLLRLHAGSGGWPLRPEGRKQAEALARQVQCLAITEIWTSPLPRARQTAEIVAGICAIPIFEDEDLRELDAGPWEGLTDDEVASRFPNDYRRWTSDPAGFVLPGRETLTDVMQRMVRAIDRRRSRGVEALIVSHCEPIRLLRVHHLGLHPNHFAEFLPQHCELLELRFERCDVTFRRVTPEDEITDSVD